MLMLMRAGAVSSDAFRGTDRLQTRARLCQASSRCPGGRRHLVGAVTGTSKPSQTGRPAMLPHESSKRLTWVSSRRPW